MLGAPEILGAIPLNLSQTRLLALSDVGLSDFKRHLFHVTLHMLLKTTNQRLDPGRGCGRR